MANMFDMVNNALMRELERLDEVDPKTKDGKGEIARALAVKETCVAAIDNANAAVKACNLVYRVKGGLSDVPTLLGGGDAEGSTEIEDNQVVEAS